MTNLKPPSTKTEIESAFKTTFAAVTTYLNTLSEVDFQKPYGEKWSAAEHLAHLTMSAFPVANAMKQTKFFFRAFGTSKNGSRTYEELYEAYKKVLANGAKADGPRIPSENDLSDKKKMLENWNMILGKFMDRMEKWSEEDLDKYRVPHPVLGKITFREMLLFTIFHSAYHLEILKKRD